MRSMTLRSIALPVAFVLMLSIAGCGSTTASRSGSGMAMGAAGGAAIGAMAGNPAMGAAIGAASGLVGGFLYDQHKKGNIDY